MGVIETINGVAKSVYDAAIKAEIEGFVMIGAELVEEEEQKKRIETCESNVCGSWNGKIRICNECKCLMDCKTWIKENPLALNDKIIKCPKNQW